MRLPEPSTRGEEDDLVEMIASVMSGQLYANNGKVHWLDTPRVRLMQKLLNKVDEFSYTPTIQLAADIANYAAMIADQGIVAMLDELRSRDE